MKDKRAVLILRILPSEYFTKLCSQYQCHIDDGRFVMAPPVDEHHLVSDQCRGHGKRRQGGQAWRCTKSDLSSDCPVLRVAAFETAHYSHPSRSAGREQLRDQQTAGEHYVLLSGLDAVSFRLANAYGPRNLSGPFRPFIIASRPVNLVSS